MKSTQVVERGRSAARVAVAALTRVRAPSVRHWLLLGATVAVCLNLNCRRCTAESAAGSIARPASFKVAETLYDGGVKPGWQDYGWGKHELSHGAARIDLRNYGGFILHHDPLSARYGALTFRMLAAPGDGAFLQVQLANGGDDKSLPAIDVGPEYGRVLPGGWVDYYVPWSSLNPSSGPFDRVIFHAAKPVSGAVTQFDKIAFTQVDAASSSAVAVVSFAVGLAASCRAPGHAISPYIYGVGGAVEPGDIGALARRWGGNPTTRYNWQLGAMNVGKDWYFENGKIESYQAFLAKSRAHHTISAITVPMIGWVAKDTTSFGFPVSVYGPQSAHDPYRPDAGNGVRADGVEIRPKSPASTSVEAPPQLMQRWVHAIREQDAKDGSRSVQMYILDNEPNLWSSTHRDVHPDPLTYDELLDRTLRYSAAIRSEDPDAVIAGPAAWGWTGYFYSAKDAKFGITLRPDRRAHGNMALIPWYLKQLHDHDQASGTKSLDVLDVHYYPQAAGVYSSASDPDTAARRLRATRSLWDPSYKDESWIGDTVRLVPRLREWIAQNYPGLRISIGEYNFGGEQHMSGALALAEALGRFGMLGVDYAFYWTIPPQNSPAYWAFRGYRNFDGKGGHFLDRSMDTHMAPDVSLFASRDATGKHLVLIALNSSPNKAANANIALPGCAPIEMVHEYGYAAGEQGIADLGAKSDSALTATLRPYSITIFDVTLK